MFQKLSMGNVKHSLGKLGRGMSKGLSTVLGGLDKTKGIVDGLQKVGNVVADASSMALPEFAPAIQSAKHATNKAVDSTQAGIHSANQRFTNIQTAQKHIQGAMKDQLQKKTQQVPLKNPSL
jgi:hypothetical protein